jgi:hypothetical protein
VLSPSALASEWVKKEYEFAHKKGKGFIPILLSRCEIPEELSKTQYFDFTELDKTWSNLQKFLNSLSQVAPRTHQPQYAQQQETDKKLLGELWKRINPEFFISTVEGIGGFMTYEQYEHVIYGYLNTREEPTTQFIDRDVEKKFIEFDLKLRQFDRLVSTHNVSLRDKDRSIYVPRFKASNWVKNYHEYPSDEAYRMSEKYEEVYALVYPLIAFYKELVLLVKTKFPEFELDREGTYYFKATW